MPEQGLSRTDALVTLPADVTLDAADALGAALRGGAGPFVIDASAVERIRTPAVLWLVSAVRSGAGVAVTGASEPFIEAFGDLGFHADLMRMEFR
ncbi:hypothetical protein ACW9UR_10855 [Halovulum sp. GXIMD14794]